MQWGKSTQSNTSRINLVDKDKGDDAEERKRKLDAEWPISFGFDYFEDVREKKELVVSGEIPSYVRGVLFRVGPGGRTVDCATGSTFKFDHLFDGLAQVHRFEIVSSKKVLYSSRHTSDEIIEQVRRLGHVGNSFTFGQGKDPCRSYFRKFISFFVNGTEGESYENGGDGNALNIGVNMSTHLPGYEENSVFPKGTVYVKTDATAVNGIHPDTLEPYGIVDQHKLHPELIGPLSSAHARTDPKTGDVYNYNLEMCRGSKYRVFRMVKATGKVEIIATVTGSPPAYIHSFFLTENYVILCIFGSHLAYGGLKVLYYRSILDSIVPLDPSIPNKFYVIDRTPANRGIVATYESEAFFAFHSINAWEDSDDIILEIPTYPNLDCLHKFYYKNLIAAEDGWKWVEKGRFQLTRIRLPRISEPEKQMPPRLLGFQKPKPAPCKQAIIEFKAPWHDSFELPIINPTYITRPHRYAYGLSTKGHSTFIDAITKYDSKTHTTKTWMVAGHTPGEPIFIVDPEGTEEDDGVIISVILDGFRRESYLLVLDAKKWVEVARVEVGMVVSLGFHGKFLGDTPGAEVEV